MNVETTAHARAIEKKIKARGAGRFLQDVLANNGHIDPATVNVLTIDLAPCGVLDHSFGGPAAP